MFGKIKILCIIVFKATKIRKRQSNVRHAAVRRCGIWILRSTGGVAYISILNYYILKYIIIIYNIRI